MLHNNHNRDEEIIIVDENKKFKEPTSSDYIYIDEDNIVHLLLPLARGENIGINNTCKFYEEPHDFFYDNNGASSVLTKYKKNLKIDIEFLEKSLETGKSSNKPIMDNDKVHSILADKRSRLKQIETYIKILEKINYDKQITDNLCNSKNPKYPKVITNVLKRKTNCFGIRLSPENIDTHLGISCPIFSLYRKKDTSVTLSISRRRGISIGAIYNFVHETLFSSLRKHLMKIKINKIPKVKTIKDELLSKVKKWVGNKKIFKETNKTPSDLQSFLKHERFLLDKQEVPMSFDPLIRYKMYTNKEIEHEYQEENIDLMAKSLLNANMDGDVFCRKSNLFTNFRDGCDNDEHKAKEKLSILVQFFLAEINLYCFSNKLSRTNFGKFFDSIWYSKRIADAVQYALENNQSVEDALFEIVDDNMRMLSLKRSLTESDKQQIIKNFNCHYRTTTNAEHFDEFLIFMQGTKGDFVNHRTRISMHFHDLVTEFKFDKQTKKDLSHELKLLKIFRNNFKKVEGEQLPSKNKICTDPQSLHVGSIKDLLGENKNEYHKLCTALFGSSKEKWLSRFIALPKKTIKSIKTTVDKWGNFLGVLKANPLALKENKKFSKNIPNELCVKETEKQRDIGAMANDQFLIDFKESLDKLLNNYQQNRYKFTWRNLFKRKSKKRRQHITSLKNMQEEICDLHLYSAKTRVEKIQTILNKLNLIMKEIKNEGYWLTRWLKPKSELLIQIRKFEINLKQKYKNIHNISVSHNKTQSTSTYRICNICNQVNSSNKQIRKRKKSCVCKCNSEVNHTNSINNTRKNKTIANDTPNTIKKFVN
ncbi:MAG: hypothetical protein PVI75_03405 [Gammaproteobacteria bacterium]|jgi:hypothetical protein